MDDPQPPDAGAPRGSGAAPDDPPAASASRTGPPRLFGVGIMAAVFAVLVIPVLVLVLVLRASGPTTYTYTVPAGTGARQDAGELVEIMPTRLDLSVGDHLVIVNQDDRVQTVGLFTVRPGETLDTPFPKPGVFKGACTMSADGQIVITVT